jgi:hypothetical protein
MQGYTHTIWQCKHTHTQSGLQTGKMHLAAEVVADVDEV